jgi:CRISPR/Cas system CMR-associated protein Cmr3 (group 5 of RAMP superfamily)
MQTGEEKSEKLQGRQVLRLGVESKWSCFDYIHQGNVLRFVAASQIFFNCFSNVL